MTITVLITRCGFLLIAYIFDHPSSLTKIPSVLQLIISTLPVMMISLMRLKDKNEISKTGEPIVTSKYNDERI